MVRNIIRAKNREKVEAKTQILAIGFYKYTKIHQKESQKHNQNDSKST